MAKEAKEKAVETKSAGDAGAAQMVKLIANPRLYRGCRGRSAIKIDGVMHVFTTDEPKEVSVELAEKLKMSESRGLQLVVNA